MDVRLAGIPAAFHQIDPALQFEGFLNVFLTDFEGRIERKTFLARSIVSLYVPGSRSILNGWPETVVCFSQRPSIGACRSR